MFCKNCGKKLPDNASFCPECGIKIKKDNAETVNKNVENQSVNIVSRVEKNKKNRNININPVVIAVISAVLVVGVVFVISPWKSHKTYKPTEVVVKNDADEDLLDKSTKKSDKDDKSEKSSKKDTSSQNNSSQNDSEYIIKDSDSRVLTESDLSGLSAEQLRIARNEIYARHGRKFKDAALQEHFNSCSWYHGTIDPDSFSDNLLNSVEMQNKDIIANYEAKMANNQ